MKLKLINKKNLLAISLVLLLVILLGTTISARSFKDIKDSGEISFAMSGKYPPFNYYEGNKLVGFDVDVAKEIAKRLGVKPEFKATAWDGIITGLRAGRYDTILGSMAIQPKRVEVVNFSIPYYFSGAQLIVRENSNINKLDQIKNKTVGVVNGTTFENDARKLGANIKFYQGDNQTMMELVNNRIDGVITDRVVGLKFKREGYKIKFVGNLLRNETMAVAVPKDSDQLLVNLNLILFEMHRDGTLNKISKKWFDVDITHK